MPGSWGTPELGTEPVTLGQQAAVPVQWPWFGAYPVAPPDQPGAAEREATQFMFTGLAHAHSQSQPAATSSHVSSQATQAQRLQLGDGEVHNFD